MKMTKHFREPREKTAPGCTDLALPRGRRRWAQIHPAPPPGAAPDLRPLRRGCRLLPGSPRPVPLDISQLVGLRPGSRAPGGFPALSRGEAASPRLLFIPQLGWPRGALREPRASSPCPSVWDSPPCVCPDHRT